MEKELKNLETEIRYALNKFTGEEKVKYILSCAKYFHFTLLEKHIDERIELYKQHNLLNKK